jgi:hypothetical protein
VQLPTLVPAAAFERLASCPWVRPEAVARGRAVLAAGLTLTAYQLAACLVERLQAERAL